MIYYFFSHVSYLSVKTGDAQLFFRLSADLREIGVKNTHTHTHEIRAERCMSHFNMFFHSSIHIIVYVALHASLCSDTRTV
jgi:hypothetical protein